MHLSVPGGPGSLGLGVGGGQQPLGTLASLASQAAPPAPSLLRCAVCCQQLAGGCGQVRPGIREASLRFSHPRTGPSLAVPEQQAGFLLFCRLEV